MRLQNQHREDGFLGRFLVISFILHIVLFVFFPEWQSTPLPGVTPGDGALQFTLRDAPDAEQVTLEPVHQRNTTPQPEPRPEPVEQEEPAPSVVREEAIVQATAPPKPPARPEPEPTSAPPERTLAAQEQPTPPQPTPRPQPEPEPAVNEPTPDDPPVMTSDSGDVAVADSRPETSEAEETSSEETAVADSADEAQDVAVNEPERVAVEAPTAAQNEPPPPPPPTAGSMLSLPGGQHFPKRISLENEITIRVFITVDEQGNIVDSEIDPATRSDNEDANIFAQQYAERLVQAEASGTGQAYQASLYVTFDPQAQGPTGIRSSTESEERVRFLNNDS